MAAAHVFRLYVAGAAPSSMSAVELLRTVCDEHLADGYELEVVDVYQQPQLALEDRVLTVPSLVRRSPAPMRRVLGHLSDRSRVLLGLELNDERIEEKSTAPEGR